MLGAPPPPPPPPPDDELLLEELLEDELEELDEELEDELEELDEDELLEDETPASVRERTVTEYGAKFAEKVAPVMPRFEVVMSVVSSLAPVLAAVSCGLP